MSLPLILPAEDVAHEWSTRLHDKLQALGLSAQELEETRLIVYHFTVIFIQEVSKDPVIVLTYSSETLLADAEKTLMMLDLFLRAVFYASQTLRAMRKPWQSRKVILENLAFKLFNVLKLLIGFWYVPHPTIQPLLKTQRDLETLLQQTVQILLDEELKQESDISLPFDLPPPYDYPEEQIDRIRKDKPDQD